MTTTYSTRFCRYCRTAMIEGTEPCGSPCLECPNCLHSVELSTVEDSTLDLAAVCAEFAACAERVGDRPTLNAINKAAWHASQGVTPVRSADAYLVPSGSRSGLIHRVRITGCDCEAGQRGRTCWHTALVNLQAVR